MPIKQAKKNKTATSFSHKTRSFNDAGISQDGGGNFAGPIAWFENESDQYSQPFLITGAAFGTYKGNQTVVLNLIDPREPSETWKCSLTSNDERAQFVHAFESDSTPLGPCCFEAIDSGQVNPYMKIRECSAVKASVSEDTELPF